MTYEKYLTEAGLTAPQAEVYEALITHGKGPARLIVGRTTLKRGLVYKALDQLVELELVEKIEDEKKIAIFSARHPNKLNDLAERKIKTAEQARIALSAISDQLVASFNLVSGRPGVRFFEGSDGFREVTNDTLSAKSEILTYVDVEAIETYVHAENAEYVKRRRRLGKKKRLIVSDSPFNRQFFNNLGPTETDVRYLDEPLPTFGAVMQIYDNKISYVTLASDRTIGVIIEDAKITEMHRALFEYTWKHAKRPISQTTPVQKPNTSSPLPGPSNNELGDTPPETSGE